MIVPKQLIFNCAKTPERQEWRHNCEARLHADPKGMVKRLGELTEVNVDRLQLWTFARAAADPRPDWGNQLWMDVAKALAP